MCLIQKVLSKIDINENYISNPSSTFSFSAISLMIRDFNAGILILLIHYGFNTPEYREFSISWKTTIKLPIFGYF